MMMPERAAGSRHAPDGLPAAWRPAPGQPPGTIGAPRSAHLRRSRRWSGWQSSPANGAGESRQPGGQVEVLRRAGDSTRMPMNPSTTEGCPARISTSGLSISFAQGGATSEIKTAVPIPKRDGDQRCAQPSRPAIRASSGKMPEISLDRVPASCPTSCCSGTSLRAGNPSRSRNRQIRVTKRMLEVPGEPDEQGDDPFAERCPGAWWSTGSWRCLVTGTKPKLGHDLLSLRD